MPLMGCFFAEELVVASLVGVGAESVDKEITEFNIVALLPASSSAPPGSQGSPPLIASIASGMAGREGWSFLCQKLFPITVKYVFIDD